jgi:hypothetical protein
MEFSNSNGLFHEDSMLKFFALSLKGNARDWFSNLGKGMFASLAEFLEAFCTRWEYGYDFCFPSFNKSENFMMHKKLLKRVLVQPSTMKPVLKKESPALFLKMIRCNNPPCGCYKPMLAAVMFWVISGLRLLSNT